VLLNARNWDDERVEMTEILHYKKLVVKLIRHSAPITENNNHIFSTYS